MMETVLNQTYKKIVTIVHSDDPRDEYVRGDIIIRGTAYGPEYGNGTYNLYYNKLLKKIPDGPGWYHFLDDDDEYASPDAIERFVDASKRDHVNVARVIRWDGVIFPREWGVQKSYQTECMLLHTDHKFKAKWPGNKNGDHFYSKQLTQVMPVNWIDKLTVCRAQEGKGHGNRLDKGKTKTNASPYKPDDLVPILALVPINKGDRKRYIPQNSFKWVKYSDACRYEAAGQARITNYQDYIEAPPPRNIFPR
jgi:hypothetical protein